MLRITLSIYQGISLSVCLSVSLFVRVCIGLFACFTLCVCVCVCIFLFIHLYNCLSVFVSDSLPAWLPHSVSLSICIHACIWFICQSLFVLLRMWEIFSFSFCFLLSSVYHLIQVFVVADVVVVVIFVCDCVCVCVCVYSLFVCLPSPITCCLV